MSRSVIMDVDFYLGLGMSLEEAEERAENSWISREEFEEQYFNNLMAIAQMQEEGR